MTQQHEIATAALTDHQMAEEMEAVNNRLRARIAQLLSDMRAANELIATQDVLNSSLRDINHLQRGENVRLQFEAKRLRELSEQRSLDLVKCRENMRGIRRHK